MGSLEAHSDSLSVFWITLGHLDYVSGTYTFRTDFGTFSKFYCQYLVRLIHKLTFCYTFVLCTLFFLSLQFTYQIDFLTLTSCVWSFHFIFIISEKKLRKILILVSSAYT